MCSQTRESTHDIKLSLLNFIYSNSESKTGIRTTEGAAARGMFKLVLINSNHAARVQCTPNFAFLLSICSSIARCTPELYALAATLLHESFRCSLLALPQLPFFCASSKQANSAPIIIFNRHHHGLCRARLQVALFLAMSLLRDYSNLEGTNTLGPCPLSSTSLSLPNSEMMFFYTDGVEDSIQ